MPSQLIHLEVAARVIKGAPAWPDADAVLGPFLLGAIAPDAWNVAGLTRSATHFWSLADDTSGAVRLARVHPQLGSPHPAQPRSRAEQAFLAGYLCHLVTDEQWTFTVYRPYFGRRSAYGASPEGARTQLALQAALEQDLRDHRAADLATWLEALAGASPGVRLPFLAEEAILRWRDLQLAGARLPTSQAGFRHVLELTGRLSEPAGGDGAARREPDWDAVTSRALAHVPPEALATFRARAGDACAALLASWG